MKSYLNPQPFAVDRIDKIQEHSEQHESQGLEVHYWRTDKKIYKHESEEQAWIDVLRKDTPHSD